MKNQSRFRSNIIALSFFFALTLILIRPAAAQSIGWGRMPAFDSSAGPALSEHGDNSIYVAAVSKYGNIFYSSTDKPGAWAPWKAVSAKPAAGFATGTSPVFARDGGTLYLFARGADNNLYRASKTWSDNWSYWQLLTVSGQVLGRFSVVLTRHGGGGDLETHVVFTSFSTGFSGIVQYLQFASSGAPMGQTRQWGNALDGSVGADSDGSNGTVGKNEVWVAVRSEKHVIVERSIRTVIPQGHGVPPANGGFQPFTIVTSRIADGPQGRIYDISNLVYFAGSFHLAYTRKYLYGDVSVAYAQDLAHTRFRVAKPDDGYHRTITSWSVVFGGTHPKAELSVYRNKLLMAYQDHQKYIRYARWDSADPATPWIGKEVIAGGLTSHRPSLATFNHRYWLRDPLKSDSDGFYANANFGDDLIAAVNGFGDDAIWVANFSREIFRQDIDRQFAIYNSNSDGLDPVCRGMSDPYAPTRVSPYSDDRPILTEIGYDLWTLPNWLAGTLYRRTAQSTCESGGAASTGWYNPPCAEARYPIVIQRAGGIFVCQSLWINQFNDYGEVFEELGHLTASTLGLEDDGNGVPAQKHVNLTGIPLPALWDAYRLFGYDVQDFPPYKRNACKRVGLDNRCQGFTKEDYETLDRPSRQHHLIYLMLYYFSDGDAVRRWVEEDRLRGDYLMKMKYDWVRQYIFRGVEFTTHNRPLTQF